MIDERIEKLAYNLINYSIALKKGERVLIEAFGVDNMLVLSLVRNAYKVGGFPHVVLRDHTVLRELIKGGNEEAFGAWAGLDEYVMQKMDCYIGIRGGSNVYELSDIDSEMSKLYSNLYSTPVHHDIRVKKTRWVVLRYPTPSMAQQSFMSTKAFEDFYFSVCNLDYQKMDSAMDNLKDLILKTKKVRLIAPMTDLCFSIEGIGCKKCSGHMNIPDGEVYTAPIKNSVNGTIKYNTPTSYLGRRFENISLTFKDGKIVQAEAGAETKRLNEILDTDEGARFIGEFAIGVNPFITKPMGDILFDEKISGSIHFTPGMCYENCNNGNVSAIHWDLVLIMTEEFGGGEIYFDDVLISKNGRFTLDSLKCLNPENLV